jgi:hypothetical protein
MDRFEFDEEAAKWSVFDYFSVAQAARLPF